MSGSRPSAHHADLPIRIDANEAWTAATAADRIRELEPFGISPRRAAREHEEVASLSEVRQAVKTPIMLDESLCSMIDAVRAKESAGGRVQHPLSSAAGFCRASIGRVCESERPAVPARHHPGESSLLTAAGRHFACSVGGLVAVEGSFRRMAAASADCSRRPDLQQIRAVGRNALTGPGLSVTIDEAALDSVTTETIHCFEAEGNDETILEDRYRHGLRRLSFEAPPPIRFAESGGTGGGRAFMASRAMPDGTRKVARTWRMRASRPTSSTGAAAAPHDVERGHAADRFA